MNRTCVRLFGLVLIMLLFAPLPPAAAAVDCEEPASAVAHAFDSGASWEMCWRIDSQLGLVISHLYYTSPENIRRKVIEEAHLAGLLVHYDDATTANDLISEYGLGSTQLLALSEATCSGEILADNTSQPVLCKQHFYKNTLTRFTSADVLQRNALSLKTHTRTGEQIWTIEFELTEDGTIIPSTTLSGRISRFSQNADFGSAVHSTGTLPRYAINATIIHAWRLDFNLDDTPDNDVVDEIQFNSDQSVQVRRRIAIQRLSAESRRQVAAELFRGWRVSDSDVSASTDGANVTRVGYYLDPQSAAYRYISNRFNWGRFQFFVTQNNPCERTVVNNKQRYPACGDTLDEFIQNSTSAGSATEDDSLSDPVLWYSLASRFEADSGDWPAIVSRKSAFKLIPFDWSETSPFPSSSASGQ